MQTPTTHDNQDHDAASTADGPSTRRQRFVAVAFTIALMIPTLAMVAGVRPDIDENRRPAPFPSVTVTALGETSLYADVDRAVNDAFPLRVPAIRAQATLDYVLLGGTANPDVVPGTDGWLFARGEVQPTCGWTTPEFLAQLDEADAMASAAGVTFRYMIAPDKHAIFPDHLPGTIDPADVCTDQRRQEVAAALRSRGSSLELWTQLLRQRTDHPDVPLYYATDTHWTPLGARMAAERLVDSLAPGLWDDAEVMTRPGFHRSTDLSRQMGLPQIETVDNYIPRPTARLRETTVDVDVALDSATDIPHFQMPPKSDTIPGRTLFLYNSFFAPHMRKLAPWFEESIWVHAEDFRQFPEIAKSLPAFDTIIVVRVERSAYDLDVADLVRPLLAP